MFLTFVCCFSSRLRILHSYRDLTISGDGQYQYSSFMSHNGVTVAQWVGAFTMHIEGWVFETQPPQTLVVKIGSYRDSSTAKRSGKGVSFKGP